VVGRTDVEDALKRLENLTHDEALMATAQVLKATDNVGDNVRVVINEAQDIGENVRVVIDGA
jgi:hypothetical protein